MKPKVLVFVNRSVTSKFNRSLIEQMSILKQFQDTHDIIHLSQYRDNKCTQYCTEVSSVRFKKVIHYIDHYEEVVKPRAIESWNKYFEDYTLINDENIEHVFIFGGSLSDASGLTRNNFRFKTSTSQQMNFVAVGILMTGVIQCIKAAMLNNATLHEICYDQCEVSCDMLNLPIAITYPYKLYHGYDDERYTRLDSLQYYEETANNEVKLFQEEKSIDFVIGMTVLTEDRKETYESLFSGLHSFDIKHRLFVKNKYSGEDSFVPREIYLDWVDKSRFTMIIPAYYPKHFSIYRMIESLYRDCLPLINDECFVDDFIKSFDIDISRICDIIVNYSDVAKTIKSFDENKRLDILTYLKSKVCRTEKLLEI